MGQQVFRLRGGAAKKTNIKLKTPKATQMLKTGLPCVMHEHGVIQVAAQAAHNVRGAEEITVDTFIGTLSDEALQNLKQELESGKSTLDAKLQNLYAFSPEGIHLDEGIKYLQDCRERLSSMITRGVVQKVETIADLIQRIDVVVAVRAALAERQPAAPADVPM